MLIMRMKKEEVRKGKEEKMKRTRRIWNMGRWRLSWL